MFSGQCSLLFLVLTGRHWPLKNVSSGDSQYRSLEIEGLVYLQLVAALLLTGQVCNNTAMIY